MTDQEQENIALIQRWFQQVWNEGSVAAIDVMYADSGVAKGLVRDTYESGPRAFKALHKLFHGAFSDIRCEIGDVMAHNESVAMRGVFTMVHKRSGRSVHLPGGCYFQLDEGRILHAWNGWDLLGLLIQLGEVPEDALVAALTRD